MKIFVAGATGAVGRRLVPLLVQRGQVVRNHHTAGKEDALRAAAARPVVMDAWTGTPSGRPSSRPTPRGRPRGGGRRADRPGWVHRLPEARRGLRSDEPASDRGNRSPARGHSRAPRSSDRGPVLRRPGFYARTGGPVKTEQDPSTRIPPPPCGGPWRPCDTWSEPSSGPRASKASSSGTGPSTARAPRSARAASSSRASGAADSPSSARARGCRRSSTSTTRPPQRLRPSRARATGWASTTSSTTSLRRWPSGCRPWPLRSGQASPARARVAGSPVRGRTRGGHDDRVPWRLQRQGQAGPRVAAVLPELVDRLQSGSGEFRGHQGGLRTNGPVA